MSNIIEEKVIEEQPDPVDLEGTKVILFQIENCICKIIKDNGEKGTGFFCKISFPDENNLLNALITNNHVLNENDVENDKIIKFKIYNKEKKKEEEKQIRIDKSRKKLTIKNEEEGIDITIIEIKPNTDKINTFLEIDANILELNCKRKSIYILHYPKDKRLVSYGLMKDILYGKKICHYCNTEKGSSGSPILSLNNFKVIGLHYGGPENKKIKYNFGTFIKYAIKELNNKYNNENKNEYNKVTTNEIIINYKIGKEDKIRIFGDEFVENNKGNFQMIIKDKNYELNSFYNIKNEKENEILEIKLKQIKDATNISYMLSGCSSLSKLADISNWSTNKI